MNKFVQEKQEGFIKSIEFFVKEISTLRVGRANPSLLDGVFVTAYGVKTPLNGLASVSVTDARSMVISPWDKSVIKDIEKSIVEADLGLGVVNEGDKIRISLPIMTEENRKNLVKKLNEKMEEARIAVRKVRDEIKSAIEQAETDKEISEDEKYQFIRELEEEVAKKNEEIKKLKEKKEEDIMTI
ncbi:MAG: Ribosome recycling factor [Parcubacteria group bacterium GW2011_GWE2_39_37]|uniref:Ribosome-recycling factor n=1 Tax=Candidatus Falkowbacteria bacterium GW2011_GWF2_39_8 TaxID=1618642 RepID=A0A0G0T226_9BACT|nr:MAG: Ribosome recycling factor [Parcubacteria group bacterium GW2011_GWE2_39_37]KKR31897.1 MAG: Ribosome recycling factor [Candidatus Falkowbacteria bacterium GW2011_GWF2_39_8]